MAAIEPTIDFEILSTYDSRVMRVADISDWKHLASESSFIDITVPGKKTAVTHYFQKGKINTFNSNNLALTNGKLDILPDGLYFIKIYVCEGCKFYTEGYYLRTVKTLLRLDQTLIDLNLNCCLPDTELLNKYSEIELLLKGAHAHLRQSNAEQAMCLYEKALELLDEFERCLEKQSKC